MKNSYLGLVIGFAFLSACGGGGGGNGGDNGGDNPPPAILPAPESIRFKDNDGDRNEISGDVILVPAGDESAIAGYSVYWADGDGKPLEALQALASRAKNSARELTVPISADTPIPSEARGLVAMAHNDNSISADGATVELRDFLGNAAGRGPGGNRKTGFYHYGENQKPTFAVQKVQVGSVWECVMDNGFVAAIDMEHQEDTREHDYPVRPQTVDDDRYQAFRYPCGDNNENTHKPIHEAASPLNDAFYFGTQSYHMFYEYLGEPPLADKVRLRVHYGERYSNAFWDGAYANFGDGFSNRADVPPVYPLTVLDVVAHEIAHGVTYRYSRLNGDQALAIDEAFADMAGEAAEFYEYGVNDWEHNNHALIEENRAVRYFAYPSADGSSIESLNDYDSGRDKHDNSGIFRKAFYLLVNPEQRYAQAQEWTLPLAFKAFALANKFCWRSETTFVQAAQCVLDESPRLLYDFSPGCYKRENEAQCVQTLRGIRQDLRKVFQQVDIDQDIGGTQAGFDPQTGFLQVQLTDRSRTDNNQAYISSWLWDFGDGEQSQESSPSHHYTQSGRYWVSLTVEDTEGNRDTYAREVSVPGYCAGAASDSRREWIGGVTIGEYTQYSGNTAAITDRALRLAPGGELPVHLLPQYRDDLEPGSVYWKIWIDFNGNGEFEDSETAFSANGAGERQGSVVMPDALPLGESRMRIAMKTSESVLQPCNVNGRGEVEDYKVVFQPAEVDVRPDFNVEIEPGTLADGAKVRVDNTSRVLTGSVFKWDFGDGTQVYSDMIHPPVHTYSAAGEYTITLTVTPPTGDELEISKPVEIELTDGYCRAGNDEKTAAERIQSVMFNTVENDTSAALDGYVDYSGQITIATATQADMSYRLTPWFRADPFGDKWNVYWRVWVDFNQDKRFDAGERVVEARSDSAVSGSFTVPANAVAGTTGMRVMLTLLDTDDPCYGYDLDDFDGGQVQDYGVNITAPVP